MSKKVFKYKGEFTLELGGVLKEPQIAYHTFGELNLNKDNVVWIFHALTASSDVENWWSGLVGEGKFIDTNKYFVICGNILGSCYGSTGPDSINPVTGKQYLHSFPQITIRDIARSLLLLKDHLQIEKIKMAIGGSCGGHQLLEWLLIDPKSIEKFTICVSGPEESPWGRAIHSAHRTVMRLDPSWGENNPKSGLEGLKAARQVGLLLYRNAEIYQRNQSETSNEIMKNFKATSYLKYQGEKLAKRFSPIAYYKLTETLDTHNISRGREISIKETLKKIYQDGLIIGIQSDLLYPESEQVKFADELPNSKLVIIESLYGHDGFLLEYKKIAEAINQYFPEFKLHK